MTDDHHSDDPELFRWVWFALGVWLFTLAVFWAVGAHRWYLKATARPTVDVPTPADVDEMR